MSEATTGPCGYLPGDAEDYHAAHCTDSRYWKERALKAESLLGLEGQAARSKHDWGCPAWSSGDDSECDHVTCGPSQPETDGGTGQQPELLTSPSVQAASPEPLEFHKPGQIPVNAPMCGKCGKMFLECQCSQASPSTPIVPGTAGLSAEQREAIEWYMAAIFWCSKHEKAPAEDWQCNFCDGFREHKPKCEYVVFTDRLNALLAAKPTEPGVPLIHGRAELDIHDARIRKSVLEEASRHQSIQFSIDLETHPYFCCSECDWKGDVWADHIRALAERPAPAGEVKGEKS